MSVFQSILNILSRFNDAWLALGRTIAWMLLMAMVVIILMQVYFRYWIGDALPWTEEVARALMIWTTGLVAGSGYRWSGFVAIDLIHDYLPRLVSVILKIILMVLALAVLIQLFMLSLEFFQRGFRTRMASVQLQRAWVYLAMPVCFGGMLIVNIEMLLREVLRLFGGAKRFPYPPKPVALREVSDVAEMREA